MFAADFIKRAPSRCLSLLPCSPASSRVLSGSRRFATCDMSKAVKIVRVLDTVLVFVSMVLVPIGILGFWPNMSTLQKFSWEKAEKVCECPSAASPSVCP